MSSRICVIVRFSFSVDFRFHRPCVGTGHANETARSERTPWDLLDLSCVIGAASSCATDVVGQFWFQPQSEGAVRKSFPSVAMRRVTGSILAAGVTSCARDAHGTSRALPITCGRSRGTRRTRRGGKSMGVVWFPVFGLLALVLSGDTGGSMCRLWCSWRHLGVCPRLQ